MKAYRGSRTEQGPVVEVEENGHRRALDPRRDLRHSDDAFEWGNGQPCGGSAQLAIALAANVLSDDVKAKQVYKRLAAKLIFGLRKDGWALTEARIRAVINLIETEQTSRQLP
jgi:Family of unknown function (DUF6166)